MSYTFTLSGRKSVLSADFYPPIELNPSHQYGLALLGFYTYNSIFNVTESNNCFAVMTNNFSRQIKLTVPPGAYEISDLEKVMVEALEVLETTNILPKPESEEKSLSVTANNNTLKCVIKCKYPLDFSVANSLGPMLGFKREKILEDGKKHESQFQVDIIKVRIIRIDCNITGGAYLNSEQSHTIFEFDIDVEPGYKLTKEPNNIIYMPLKPSGRQFIDNITLRILDDNGHLIDFRGEKIIVKLELKKLL